MSGLPHPFTGQEAAELHPSLTPSGKRRGLLAIMGSVLGVGMTFGTVVPMLSLILELKGVESGLIGLNASMAVLAVFVMGPVTPWLAHRFGTLPCMYGGLILILSTFLLLPVFPNVWAWFPLRFLVGVGMAIHWIVSETWLNMIATPRNRGKIMGAYIAVLSAGFASGPVLVTFIGTEGVAPFAVCGLLVVLSALPLLLANGRAPEMPLHETSGLLPAIIAAPVLMIGAFTAGFGDTAVMALLPIYGLHSGFDQETSVLMLSVMIAGSVTLQLPAGWLADRFDRWRLLLLGGVGGFIGAALLPFSVGDTLFLAVLLFLWGGTVVALYTLGLTLLGERFPAGQLAGANAAFVMIYSAGSTFGPALSGYAMEIWDPHGMPVLLSFLAAVFLAAALFFGRARA